MVGPPGVWPGRRRPVDRSSRRGGSGPMSRRMAHREGLCRAVRIADRSGRPLDSCPERFTASPTRNAPRPPTKNSPSGTDDRWWNCRKAGLSPARIKASRRFMAASSPWFWRKNRCSWFRFGGDRRLAREPQSKYAVTRTMVCRWRLSPPLLAAPVRKCIWMDCWRCDE